MKFLNPNGSIRKLVALLLAVVVLILVLVWTGNWLHFRMTHVMTDDARVDGEVTTLSSRVGGWITSMPVVEGDAIRVGQVLTTIDDRDTRLKRAALQAQLDSNLQQQQAQEAQIRQIDISSHGELSTAQGKLQSANASRDSLQHRLELARADYRRSEDLAAKHFVSPQALDQARTNLSLAEAEVRRSEGDIAASKGTLAVAQGSVDQLGVLRAKLQASHADAEQIRAQIAALDAELADRTIRSPVNGHVVTTFSREREYVAAGQRLMMVHDPRQQWVEANIKETDIALVQLGQVVEVRATALPDQVFYGKVIRIGGAATSKFALLPDPNPSGNFTKITQRLPVRIAFNQSMPKLHPGMMVEVAIEHR